MDVDIKRLPTKVKQNSYRLAIAGWNSGYAVPGGWNFNLADVIVSLSSYCSDWDLVWVFD
jgi:hypothetical protein